MLVAFAVVIVGGISGNLAGTFVAAFALGMVIADHRAFLVHGWRTRRCCVVMALVLLKDSFSEILAQADGDGSPGVSAACKGAGRCWSEVEQRGFFRQQSNSKERRNL